MHCPQHPLSYHENCTFGRELVIGTHQKHVPQDVVVHERVQLRWEVKPEPDHVRPARDLPRLRVLTKHPHALLQVEQDADDA